MAGVTTTLSMGKEGRRELGIEITKGRATRGQGGQMRRNEKFDRRGRTKGEVVWQRY